MTLYREFFTKTSNYYYSIYAPHFACSLPETSSHILTVEATNVSQLMDWRFCDTNIRGITEIWFGHHSEKQNATIHCQKAAGSGKGFESISEACIGQVTCPEVSRLFLAVTDLVPGVAISCEDGVVLSVNSMTVAYTCLKGIYDRISVSWGLLGIYSCFPAAYSHMCICAVNILVDINHVRLIISHKHQPVLQFGLICHCTIIIMSVKKEPRFALVLLPRL